MSYVTVGGNRLYECENVLGYRNEPLLTATMRGMHPVISLNLDRDGLPERLHVSDNKVLVGRAHVDVSVGRVSIVVETRTILLAVSPSGDVLDLTIDFRHVGLNVHSDASALYVGGARISSNAIRRAKFAISLG